MAMVGLVAGAIASVSGFGIGSLLTPVLGVQVGTKLAVAAVSVPHVTATALRFWIMREHVDRRLLWSFRLDAECSGRFDWSAACKSMQDSPAAHNSLRHRLLMFTGVMGLTGLSERMQIQRVGWRGSLGPSPEVLGGLVGNAGRDTLGGDAWALMCHAMPSSPRPRQSASS